MVMSKEEKRIKSRYASVMKRATDRRFSLLNPTYLEVTVCDEWLVYENFRRWYLENYVEGWSIDKDLLSGMKVKVYSPETCCFLPQIINATLANHLLYRGKYKKVTTDNPHKIKVYGDRKEANIKKLAEEYKDQLKPSIYKALLEYTYEGRSLYENI